MSLTIREAHLDGCQHCREVLPDDLMSAPRAAPPGPVVKGTGAFQVTNVTRGFSTLACPSCGRASRCQHRKPNGEHVSITSRGYTISSTLELVTEECCNCGITFAMPRDFQQACLAATGVGKGKAFYCPNGHRQWYTGKTETQKQRERAERLERDLDYMRASRDAARDQAEAAERQRNGYKGQLALTKKRVAAGVCPCCCRRSFADLARHMSGKHPDYGKANEDGEKS